MEIHLVEYSVVVSPIDEAWTRYLDTEKAVRAYR